MVQHTILLSVNFAKNLCNIQTAFERSKRRYSLKKKFVKKVRERAPQNFPDVRRTRVFRGRGVHGRVLEGHTGGGEGESLLRSVPEHYQCWVIGDIIAVVLTVSVQLQTPKWKVTTCEKNYLRKNCTFWLKICFSERKWIFCSTLKLNWVFISMNKLTNKMPILSPIKKFCRN